MGKSYKDDLSEKNREIMPDNLAEKIVKVFYSSEEPDINKGMWKYYALFAFLFVAIDVILISVLNAFVYPTIVGIVLIIAGSQVVRMQNKKTIAEDMSYAFALSDYGNIYVIDSKISQLDERNSRYDGIDTGSVNYAQTMNFYKSMNSSGTIRNIEYDINNIKSLKSTVGGFYSAIRTNSIKVSDTNSKYTEINFWDDTAKRFGNYKIGKIFDDREELIKLVNMNRTARREYAKQYNTSDASFSYFLENIEIVPDTKKLILKGTVNGSANIGQMGFLVSKTGKIKGFAIESILVKNKQANIVKNDTAVITTSVGTGAYKESEFEVVSIDRLIIE